MSKGLPGQGQKGIHRSGDGVWGKVIPNPKLKLLDQVRESGLGVRSPLDG